jgi:hypothetical protein
VTGIETPVVQPINSHCSEIPRLTADEKEILKSIFEKLISGYGLIHIFLSCNSLITILETGEVK